VISAAPPDAAAVTWIPCQGWFSARPHDGAAWIGVADGRIATITTTPPAGDNAALTEAPLYVAPLLADTHVHVYMEPWPVSPALRAAPGSKPFELEVADAIRRVDQALASGVGLLRDMGDPFGINLEVKRRLTRRASAAPELLVAGPGFHRPKKYGRFLGVCRETVDDVRASIDKLHRQGQVDYIKVVTTGIVDFAERRVKQSPQYSADELAAVVAHAHDLGYKVASHCSGEEGIDINLAAGVDFIEHAYFVREDQIDRMIEQGTAWTPTFAPVDAQGQHVECGWSDDVRLTIEAILDEHAARIAYGMSRGATILAGTDAGSPGVDMGGGIRIELQRLATAGISAEKLLHMATIGNARSVGALHYSGTIEVGGPASFALYERCPWRDIRNLDSLKHVFWSGERIR
jgi:imidazolonepropionase-like amidohydrolase